MRTSGRHRRAKSPVPKIPRNRQLRHPGLAPRPVTGTKGLPEGMPLSRGCPREATCRPHPVPLSVAIAWSLAAYPRMDSC